MDTNKVLLMVGVSALGALVITGFTLSSVIKEQTKMENLKNGLSAVFGGIESAPYEVIETKEVYEVRKYPARKWAATSMSGGIDRREATSAMFRRLFNYISGENTKNMSIAMTAPVSVFYEPGSGPNCANTWTEAFYIPQVHQEDPPTGQDIFVQSRPEMTVYSKRFGGYANDEVIAKEASELAEALTADAVPDVEFNSYYFAGYDSPFKPINRRNEIWFVKKE